MPLVYLKIGDTLTRGGRGGDSEADCCRAAMLLLGQILWGQWTGRLKDAKTGFMAGHDSFLMLVHTFTKQ